MSGEARIKRKHFKALLKNDQSSAIADHVKNTGHTIKWDHSLAYGQFRTTGAVTFLPEKCTEFQNAWLLKLVYKRTQTRSQFTVRREIFRRIILRILDFSGFAGKKLSILDFGLYSWDFSRYSCAVLEGNKYGSHMVVFVALFCDQFHWSSAMEKTSKFLQDFCWRAFVFTGFNYRRSMKNLRNSRQLDPR